MEKFAFEQSVRHLLSRDRAAGISDHGYVGDICYEDRWQCLDTIVWIFRANAVNGAMTGRRFVDCENRSGIGADNWRNRQLTDD